MVEKPQDADLFRRRRSVTALARIVAASMGLLCLLVEWQSPLLEALPATLLLAFYVTFALSCAAWSRRHPRQRRLRVVHDVVDGLVVGLGSALSGGLESPLWLLLYPHAAAVSVRGGLRYAMLLGSLDATLIGLLALATPSQPMGGLHALALLFCSFLGGSMSSYLATVQQRLSAANRELSAKNTQLSATVARSEVSQREQELALSLLRQSEARYERLLERIQDGVLIIQDGRLAYVNQVFATLVGTPREALLGREFLELVPIEQRAELLDRYQRWQHSEAVSGTLEVKLHGSGPEPLLTLVKAGAVVHEGRLSVIATVRDITRERRMEQDIQAHAERLAVINEIANAVNQSLTIDDILGVAAAETRRLVPFDRLTLALLEDDESSVEVVTPGGGGTCARVGLDAPPEAAMLREPVVWCAGEAAAPPHSEALMRGPGVRALVRVPLRSKDRVIGSLNLGRELASAFSSLDLTVLESVARHVAIALDNARLLEHVRRRSQEFESLLEIGRGVGARLELEELLPLITRSVNRVMRTHHCVLLLRLGDALVLAAQEGLEPEVVQGFADLRVGEGLTGWVVREGQILTMEDMRNDPRLKLGALVARYGYRSYLGVPLRRGDEVLGSLEVVTKRSRVFGAQEQALMTAFADQAGVALDNARLFDAARSSLAQAVEANRRLEELDRLRKEYLRNVSHEFRTPLTVIKGYAEFLQDSGGVAAITDSMKIIIESCDRVIDMVDTLIEVSRIEQEAADRILQVATLDGRELITGSVDWLRAAAEKKQLRLTLELPPSGFTLEGDAGLLHHVVRKLLDNAIKYSLAGREVVVQAHLEPDTLEISVRDSGIGIAPEHLPRIFEKFYMVDGGITRRVGGTGVGLYLVQEIVRLHHGSVAVSSSLGEGSRFTVRLPLRFAAEPA